MAEDAGEFYVRYYVGHKGKFGHEFLEFEFRPDGKLRYANNSNYKNDTMIRKEVFLTEAVLRECRRIIAESEIMKEDDNNWPEPDRVGRQELEIVMGNDTSQGSNELFGVSHITLPQCWNWGPINTSEKESKWDFLKPRSFYWFQFTQISRRELSSSTITILIMGVLSNRISREDLRPGDHVYSWRIAYTYSHHGIYVGDNKVIHFTRGKAETENNVFLDLLLISSGYSKTTKACEVCSHQQDIDGVMCSCLDCFLDGGELYRFEYGVNPGFFLAKFRGGTCTLAESDPPETVLHRATYLLQNGFGCYNVFKNNCEDFAVYCKTGLLVIDGLNVGSQAASILATVASVFSSPLRFLTTSIPGITVVAGGVYCVSRLVADIGNRKNAVKVPVESLTARLGINDLPVMSSISAEPVLQVQM